MTPQDAMRRYLCEIHRQVDAAERLCDGMTCDQCHDGNCCMTTPDGEECILQHVRLAIGDTAPLPPGAVEMPPVGTCDRGIVSGTEILCKTSAFCQYQQGRVTASTSPYFRGLPGVYAVCTRESAALALAEEQPDDSGKVHP